MSFVVTRDRMNKLLFDYFDKTDTEEQKYTIDDIDFFIDEKTFQRSMQEAHNFNSKDIHEFESFLTGYLGEHVRIGKRILEMNDTKVLRAFLRTNDESSPDNVLSQLIDLLAKEDIVEGIRSGISHICDTVSTTLDYNNLNDKTKVMLKKILEKELQDMVHEVINDTL